MLKVRLEGRAIDKDIIELNDNTDFEEVAKDVVHGGLECGRGIRESEGHHKELVVSKARTECGLVGVLADADMVEATAEVNFVEVVVDEGGGVDDVLEPSGEGGGRGGRGDRCRYGGGGWGKGGEGRGCGGDDLDGGGVTFYGGHPSRDGGNGCFDVVHG
ncbi:hypothetical protein CBR_g24262 [Chara braunii]|uniref:Uncharacterized protein n=1 Tax=Chara braunii TaxID=69332 RepID=A0A388JMB3_CHABU|nr:hypothetical protein CBR_g24262 [Chara braunii]|eukprot:GBG58911.1 hypothetical protein CBR_g24262 [Chara braunii]